MGSCGRAGSLALRRSDLGFPSGGEQGAPRPRRPLDSPSGVFDVAVGQRRRLLKNLHRRAGDPNRGDVASGPADDVEILILIEPLVEAPPAGGARQPTDRVADEPFGDVAHPIDVGVQRAAFARPIIAQPRRIHGFGRRQEALVVDAEGEHAAWRHQPVEPRERRVKEACGKVREQRADEHDVVLPPMLELRGIRRGGNDVHAERGLLPRQGFGIDVADPDLLQLKLLLEDGREPSVAGGKVHDAVDVVEAAEDLVHDLPVGVVESQGRLGELEEPYPNILLVVRKQRLEKHLVGRRQRPTEPLRIDFVDRQLVQDEPAIGGGMVAKSRSRPSWAVAVTSISRMDRI